MARIDTFEEGRAERARVHDPIGARYYLLEADGERLFQMNTYGRATRDMPEKVSQSIQLDESAARELVAILRHHFDIE